MFAFLDLNPAKVAQFAVNSLAVVGGFFAGWVLFGFIAWALDRYAFLKKSPQGVKRVIRLVGGILVAILVALIVFGHGQGWTLFGGGMPGDDNGGNPNPATETTSKEQKKPESSPTPAKNLPPAEATEKVTMLGGDDVKNEKFYLLDGDPAAKTFAQVTASLRAKKDGLAGKRLAVEIRFPEANVLPRDHPAVIRLARWANEAGITVTFPADR
ncbi:MAG TPA: hypothetical protein VGJ05_14570 [Fimbriiglobus sp.]|jgi:hypothetical protein